MHFCWIFLYKQKCFFSVITNNLNWEILNKNSVTFKRWDGVKDQRFWYCRGFTEKSDIGGEWGGVPEKPIYREELLKKGGLGQFPDLGGAWQKKGGGVFEGGWCPYLNYGF